MRAELHPRINLIVGKNGQGKTSFLEAVALLAGRPSFRTADLSALLRDGADRGSLSVRRAGPDGIRQLGLSLARGSRAHVLDGRPIARSQASRELPVVLLTAEDRDRLTGPPAGRRRALDRLALLLFPQHAARYQVYEKARAARNRLLTLGDHADPDELDVYESEMCRAGAEVGAARRGAVTQLAGAFAEKAERFDSPFRDLTVSLASDLPESGTVSALADAFSSLLKERRRAERRAGRTLVGPFRDDLRVDWGGLPLAQRASSGQSRTLLLAWTLSEMEILAKSLRTEPILAFDDFDSEWDPTALSIFAGALRDDVQVFLTSAREEAVRALPLPGGALYRMESGTLSRVGILGGGRSAPRVEAVG